MKINKSKYVGYIWYSDQTTPEQFLGNEDFEIEIGDNVNPFIIEGLLYDGNHSITIKYVDGHYIVKDYLISSFDGIEMTRQIYFSNRMDNRTLLFNQYWREKKDDLCEGMNVLQPAELVFVGFEK